jgi:RHS repeat-associated protein
MHFCNPVWSFPSYDSQGDLLKRVDGRGVETDYAYSDPDNLITGVSYPATPSQNATYSYDAYGRVTGVTDGAVAAPVGPGIVLAYDDNDNVTGTQTTYVGQTAGTYLPTQTIGYTYNPDGSTASIQSPSGTFTYGYDGNGRSSSLTNPFGETTSWTYQDNGWLKTRSMFNGVCTTNTFDADGELLEMATKNSASSVLSDFTIPSTGGYDGAGNILSRTDTIASNPNYSGTTSYAYDNKDQLTQEISTRSGGYTNNLAFDAGAPVGPGNATTFKSNTNTYNQDNQYTTSGYTYDGNGNPITYKGVNLTFDAEDRLTSYGTQLTNGYTTTGLRAWKQNNAGVRTYFLYVSGFPICELDASGNVTATNTFGHDGLISRRVGTTSTYYAFDPQGNPVQFLNASGNISNTAMFDAYGTRASVNATTDPYAGFGAQWGYYTDSETGLELCTYRFYDPANGRWLNRDPSGYDGGINLYNYVGNSPTDGNDPSGLYTELPVPPWLGPAGQDIEPGELHWHPPDAGHPEAHWDWDQEGDPKSPDFADQAKRQWRYYPKSGKWEEKAESIGRRRNRQEQKDKAAANKKAKDEQRERQRLANNAKKPPCGDTSQNSFDSSPESFRSWLPMSGPGDWATSPSTSPIGAGTPDIEPEPEPNIPVIPRIGGFSLSWEF